MPLLYVERFPLPADDSPVRAKRVEARARNAAVYNEALINQIESEAATLKRKPTLVRSTSEMIMLESDYARSRAFMRERLHELKDELRMEKAKQKILVNSLSQPALHQRSKHVNFSASALGDPSHAAMPTPAPPRLPPIADNVRSAHKLSHSRSNAALSPPRFGRTAPITSMPKPTVNGIIEQLAPMGSLHAMRWPERTAPRVFPAVNVESLSRLSVDAARDFRNLNKPR